MTCPDPAPRGLVLAVGRDLMFSSKISGAARTAGRNYRGVRSVQDLKKGLEEDVSHVILDLNVQGMDIPEAVRAVQAAGTGVRLVAYYSHVETESARQARDLGVSEIYARSKFVQILPQLF